MKLICKDKYVLHPYIHREMFKRFAKWARILKLKVVRAHPVFQLKTQNIVILFYLLSNKCKFFLNKLKFYKVATFWLFYFYFILFFYLQNLLVYPQQQK